jgi:hypothetical protein
MTDSSSQRRLAAVGGRQAGAGAWGRTGPRAEARGGRLQSPSALGWYGPFTPFSDPMLHEQNRALGSESGENGPYHPYSPIGGRLVWYAWGLLPPPGAPPAVRAKRNKT